MLFNCADNRAMRSRGLVASKPEKEEKKNPPHAIQEKNKL